MAHIIKGSPASKPAVATASPQMSIPKQTQGTTVLVGPGGMASKPIPPGSTVSPQPVPVPQGISPAGGAAIQGVPGILTPQMATPNGSTVGQPSAGMMPVANQATATVIRSSNDTTQMNGNQNENQLLQEETNITLANTKEKTPMCLINELARYNKIPHQYTLTDEQGPAHKKTFYVKLKLGEEEYAASGPSIKKAQHAAAGIALEKTQYPHPPPKIIHRGIAEPGDMLNNDSITPTVELNALVMKRGEPAIYRPIEMPRPQYYPPPNLDFRGMYNQRYHYPRFPRVFYVSLKVGQREFIGEGNTRQAARHAAAAKALKVLRNLPLPNQDLKIDKPEEVQEEEEIERDAKDALKSEISLVHEIALKRNLAVNFEVTRESGPPHMRTFVTRCTVGQFVTEGEGNGKKVSKKRAAEKMLEELRKLPGMPPAIVKPKRNAVSKKKNRNLIKVSPPLQKADPNYGMGINPISRLIQIQQAKKEKEPIYTLVAERGVPRRREFVMQVQVGEHTCNGVGPNKKLAKRSAAEAMLQLLGYSRPSPQPAKPAIKSGDGQVVSDKKVTFVDAETNSSRQLVPGLLLMPDGTGLNQGFAMNQTGLARGPNNQIPSGLYSPQTTALIAKELLDTGCSPTAESLDKSGAKAGVTQSNVSPQQQLMYLANILGFEVQFTDFPKGTNKTEFLSLVSLSTNPPQVSHGSGPTIEASHDMAARTALKALSECGLDHVSATIKKEDNKMASGDGPHIKSEVTDGQANSTDLVNSAPKTEAT